MAYRFAQLSPTQPRPVMTTSTAQLDQLPALASRFVDVASLPWMATQNPGIEMKILLEDKASGMMTALIRWQPGAELALHEHVEIEQTYILEGHLVDAEGEVTAGNFVWRPKGSRHVARSPNGALMLAFFLRPNIFLDGESAGQPFRSS